jgi:hypothetical protein
LDNSMAQDRPAEIIHLVDDESSDVVELPAISRGFSSTSDRSERSSFSESSGPSERPAKKRRISPIPAKPVSPETSQTPIPLAIASSNATSKKAPTSIFLGSFVCGNAFSAVKGRGYSAPGEVIHITRDDPDDELPKPSAKGKGKASSKSSSGGKKQLTLSTLMKPAPNKKKKAGMIVRINNPRGFGRLIVLSLNLDD